MLFLNVTFDKKLLLMKKLIFLPLVLLIISCNDSSKPYYDQITSDKAFVERISDLNKTIENIRKSEKGKLINEGLDRLKYEYSIGSGDRYILTYIFDEKGCFEIGFDGYFEEEENVKKVLEGFIDELKIKNFGTPKEDNQLVRFISKDKTKTIEFDYKNSDKGIAKAIIFANE